MGLSVRNLCVSTGLRSILSKQRNLIPYRHQMDRDDASLALHEKLAVVGLAKQATETDVVELSHTDEVEEGSLRGYHCRRATRWKVVKAKCRQREGSAPSFRPYRHQMEGGSASLALHEKLEAVCKPC